MNRIIQAVPEADVVITKSTHLALCTRYRPGEDAAPIVTAKGADSLAAYIRSQPENTAFRWSKISRLHVFVAKSACR